MIKLVRFGCVTNTGSWPMRNKVIVLFYIPIIDPKLNIICIYIKQKKAKEKTRTRTKKTV